MLAVDRNNSRVADLYDTYHPAVLHALQQIALRCQELNKPLSVCGEFAGEPWRHLAISHGLSQFKHE